MSKKNKTILDKIRAIWGIIVEYLNLLMQVRFSIIIAVVVFMFMMIPQGQEALIAMMENAELNEYGQRNYFIVTTILLATMSWYFARTLYLFSCKEENESNKTWMVKAEKHKFFKEHFPRWLGFLMILFPAITVLLIAEKINTLSIYLFIAAVVFLLFVYSRRKVLKLKNIPGHENLHERVSDLQPHSRYILIASIILNWLLLIVFTFFGQTVSVEIGATSVVMLAMATLVSVGSSITYFAKITRLPMLLFFVILAVATSVVMDNHAIRLIDKKDCDECVTTTIRDHFADWYGIRRIEQKNDKPVPVYFVSTEGGGIRAAYWTAIVLARLQDKNPEFANHLYSISGVSGGSLGASVFDALLTKEPAMAKNGNTKCTEDDNNYFCRSKRILSNDFLAPTVANMMFPDSFQRFCFFCRFNDRAQALEQSWERAWEKEWDVERGQGVFSQPFENLWADDNAMKIPQLFLNSTVVETGQRIIATPLHLGATFGKTFHDALATFDVTNPDQTMRLSTATLTSARFTYVSPAGTLKRADKKDERWIRLVDGGYFENSGSTASIEMLNEINENYIDNNKIKPIVIHISNEPGYPDRDEEKKGSTSQASFMSEVLSPLLAIFNVRGGKGREAQKSLEYLTKRDLRYGEYYHFNIPRSDKVILPLGWMLSVKAQNYMDNLLLDYHEDNINAIIKSL